ncbi:Trm112p-domain-containing protein [Rhizopus microsporus var. microsporus]|uniref:Trm112p-domain-containing protein n=2 Tax=Rhizopus microsporus TaxID=58291 RepID=A0A2G4SI31_RHIZD|nr:Trm112p-domain-containing protein [Rhizopus microsporus ATCC 52813]ORE04298.1 Trm112p-domain-containing protein [Rhizopus microsporus var. microsporus]PHZ08425.1 Trm112p-domain-containing protein [Rhizopus microsporus ATCC 52813]
MRLITHNMLQCHVKNCNTNNFPLRFEDAQVELIEAEFNPDFMANVLNKLDWDALRNTAIQLGINTLPEEIPENAEENEEFLKVLHAVILETHVQQGQMICPNCNHVYKIKDGIPNMLLAEHEI